MSERLGGLLRFCHRDFRTSLERDLNTAIELSDIPPFPADVRHAPPSRTASTMPKMRSQPEDVSP